MVLIVDALTWFLVCCCALSLLLACRGVSLGMGPIGVGYGKRKGQNKDFTQKQTLLQKKRVYAFNTSEPHAATLDLLVLYLISF